MGNSCPGVSSQKSNFLGLCMHHTTIMTFSANTENKNDENVPSDVLRLLSNFQSSQFHVWNFYRSDAADATLFRQLHIDNTPTILLFRPDSHKLFQYDGEMTASAIMESATDEEKRKQFAFKERMVDRDILDFLLPPPQKAAAAATMEPSVVKQGRLQLSARRKTLLAFTGEEWCGHCKAIKGDLEKIDELSHSLTHDCSEQDRVDFIQFDVPYGEGFKYPIAEKFKVAGFPTLLIFTPQSKSFVTYPARRLAELAKFLEHKPSNFLNVLAECQPYSVINDDNNEDITEEVLADVLNHIDLVDTMSADTKSMVPYIIFDVPALSNSKQDYDLNAMNDQQQQHALRLKSLQQQHQHQQQQQQQQQQQSAYNNDQNAGSGATTLLQLPIKLDLLELLKAHESPNQATADKVVVNMSFCDTCATIIAFTSDFCYTNKQFDDQWTILSRKQKHGKFHFIRLHTELKGAENVDDVCDTFGINSFPTVLIFNPLDKKFYHYTGLLVANSMMNCDLHEMNVWPNPPNLRLSLRSEYKKERTPTRYVSNAATNNNNMTSQPKLSVKFDLHAQTNGVIKMCPNCATVIVFALRKDTLAHLTKQDGHDNMHVYHYNSEDDLTTMNLFGVADFPMVLVYFPQEHLFRVYSGDCSDVSHLKKSVKNLEHLDQVWKIHPQVMFSKTLL